MKFKQTAILLAVAALASVSVAHMTADLTAENPSAENAAAANPVAVPTEPVMSASVETIQPEVKSPMVDEAILATEKPVIAVAETPPALVENTTLKLPPPPPGATSVVASTPSDKPAAGLLVSSEDKARLMTASSTQETTSASGVTADKSGVAMSSDILFGFNGSTLGPDARVLLDRLLPRLKSMELDIVLATGHADRIGSDRANDKIALRRANAVRGYLVSRGIPADKVRVDSKGSSEPVTTDCDNKKGATLRECYAPDRRVNVTAQGYGTATPMPTPSGKSSTSRTSTVGQNTTFTVFFEGNSIKLKSTDNDLLDEIADAALEAEKVHLRGRSAIGDSEQRKARAIARGWAVRQGLVFRGVEKEDIRIFYRTKGFNSKENNERVDVHLIPKKAEGKSS